MKHENSTKKHIPVEISAVCFAPIWKTCNLTVEFHDRSFDTYCTIQTLKLVTVEPVLRLQNISNCLTNLPKYVGRSCSMTIGVPITSNNRFYIGGNSLRHQQCCAELSKNP